MSVDPALRYSGDFVPRLKPNLDLNSVVIGAEDHFLFSRLDGRTTVRQIASLVGKSPMHVAAGLLRLEARGVILAPDGAEQLPDSLVQKQAIADAEGASSDRQGSRKNFAKRINKVSEADLIGVGRFEGFMFPRGPLEEICALEINVRKEMLFLDARIEDMSPFKVIDLPLSADDGRIMRQADKKLRMFHPDTYFGQEVGSFGPIILRLYNKVREAADLLLDPEKRSELRTQLLGVSAEEIKEEELPQEVREARQKERERISAGLRHRRLKKNPMFANISRAKTLYQEAMKFVENKEFAKAHNAIMAAKTFDPRNPLYTEMEERMRVRASDHRSEPHVKAAEFAMNVGRWDQAEAAFKNAAKICAHRPEYWARAAECCCRVGEDLQEAANLAQKAIDIAPDNTEFLRVMLNILDTAGMDAKARNIAEQIGRLDPAASDIQERLKKKRR